MDIFPDEWELISFFEQEPTLKDSNVPWCYNHLSFRYAKGSDVVCVQIEPGDKCIQLRWKREDHDLLYLEVRDVIDLRIDDTRGEKLIAKTDRNLQRVMTLQLRPTVYVSFTDSPQGSQVK